MNGLLIQALLAFVALPGLIAFLIPVILLAPDEGSFADLRAFIPLGAGIALLLWCVTEFYRAGRGTLAPWAPPKQLVVTGLYRYSRNPMYIAVLLVLLGWFVGFRSATLAAYGVVMMVVFHLRVVLHEEPFLARTHGDQWSEYSARVPRWLGLPKRLDVARRAG